MELKRLGYGMSNIMSFQKFPSGFLQTNKLSMGLKSKGKIVTCEQFVVITIQCYTPASLQNCIMFFALHQCRKSEPLGVNNVPPMELKTSIRKHHASTASG